VNRLLPAWIGWALVCTFCWGLFGFLAKLGSDHVSPADMQVLFTVGMLPLALAPFVGKGSGLETGRNGIVVGIVIGVFAGLGAIAYFAAMRAGNASLVGPVTSLFPMITVVLAMLFLRERLNWIQLVGIGLALAAVAILSV